LLRDGGSGHTDGLVRIAANGFEFRARVRNLDGPGDGIVLLHGWPQSSIAWEPLADALAAAGYRVAAVDQRGYSPGARPEGVLDYSIAELVDDVIAIADALGFDRFHLVGHDWGAAVGWGLVMTRPERVLSWSALSIPHSVSFVEAVQSDPVQRRKSAYILFLRTRRLAEAVLGWGRLRVFRRVMYRYMPDAHAAEYLKIFSEPGALTAILNWYRAMGKGPSLNATPGIGLPVLFAWGNRDPAVSRRAVEDQARFMLGPYTYLELDAGHWLLERRTGEVVRAVMQHIAENTETGNGAASAALDAIASDGP
jgi:pimeloyl-ACP methyl ester carboxylesterase